MIELWARWASTEGHLGCPGSTPGWSIGQKNGRQAEDQSYALGGAISHQVRRLEFLSGSQTSGGEKVTVLSPVGRMVRHLFCKQVHEGSIPSLGSYDDKQPGPHGRDPRPGGL